MLALLKQAHYMLCNTMDLKVLCTMYVNIKMFNSKIWNRVETTVNPSLQHIYIILTQKISNNLF